MPATSKLRCRQDTKRRPWLGCRIAPSAMGGAVGLAQLMARDPKVDAVFCSNDMIALGALFEARRLGINVPKQLKICVFGDLEFWRRE